MNNGTSYFPRYTCMDATVSPCTYRSCLVKATGIPNAPLRIHYLCVITVHKVAPDRGPNQWQHISVTPTHIPTYISVTPRAIYVLLFTVNITTEYQLGAQSKVFHTGASPPIFSSPEAHSQGHLLAPPSPFEQPNSQDGTSSGNAGRQAQSPCHPGLAWPQKAVRGHYAWRLSWWMMGSSLCQPMAGCLGMKGAWLTGGTCYMPPATYNYLSYLMLPEALTLSRHQTEYFEWGCNFRPEAFRGSYLQKQPVQSEFVEGLH